MRSLSPGLIRYAGSFDGGRWTVLMSSSSGCAAAGCTASVQKDARAMTPKRVRMGACFIACSSVLVRGPHAAAPVDDWTRQCPALQRFGVDRVSRITGRADRDPQDGRELVVVN